MYDAIAGAQDLRFPSRAELMRSFFRDSYRSSAAA
jgi:hypothetical protein